MTVLSSTSKKLEGKTLYLDRDTYNKKNLLATANANANALAYVQNGASQILLIFISYPETKSQDTDYSRALDDKENKDRG